MKITTKLSSIFILFLLSSFLYSCFPQPLSAQFFDLSISPPISRITVKPDRAVTQAFNIKNDSDADIELTPRIVPFTPAGILGQAKLTPEKTPDWLNYFSFANSKIFINQPFTLKARSSDQIVVSFKAPATAFTQDIYATLLLTSTSSPNPDNQTFVSGSIGGHLLISISSIATPPTSLKIDTFTLASKPIFSLPNRNFYLLDSLSPIDLKAVVTNTGNHLTQIEGIVQLNQNNQPTQVIPLLPVYVLANSQRQLLASSSAEISSLHLTFPPSASRFGSFSPFLYLKSASDVYTKSFTIVVLPIKIILGLITAIIILTTILINFKKKAI